VSMGEPSRKFPSKEHERLAEPYTGFVAPGENGDHLSANDPGGACGKTTVRMAVRGSS